MNLRGLFFDGLCAADDLHELFGDRRLASPVVLEREFADHRLGVSRGGIHGGHARTVFGGV